MQIRSIFVSVIALLALPTMTGHVWSADHLDAPSLEALGKMDVNDIYAFQSPTNANNTVLIMTVNPFADMNASFAEAGAEYQLMIDNTGDAVTDITYTATFSADGAGQNLSLTKNGASIASGAVGMQHSVTGGGTVQAGLFDDPFFFDLGGFLDGFNFTGVDAFAGANITAIVLEVPSSELGGPNIGVSARTLDAGVQIDRMGRPAINTALIPSDQKEAFNKADPVNDLADFGDAVRASITGLSNADNAEALTPVLLPDLLTFDTSSADGFLNGRKLGDDVIDAELNLLSAGAVTGDGVNGNDVPFRGSFPYLAAPNIVPEPSSMTLSLFGLLFGWRIIRFRIRD